MFEVRAHERDINEIERQLDVKFPTTYRTFLLERGSAVIDGYRILGIPREEGEEIKEEILDLNKIAEDTSCPVCKRKKQKDKITCFPCYNLYSRETNREIPLSVWLKEKLSLQRKEEREKAKKEEKEISVADATSRLQKVRPDSPKELVVISFNRNGKALCLGIKIPRTVLRKLYR